MALQPAYGLEFPPYVPFHQLMAGTPHASTAMTASGHRHAFVLTMPKAGTIDTIAFLTGAVSSADTLKVSLQDMDASTGNPDAGADEYRTIASGSVTANTWLETGLVTSDGTDSGTKRTVTRGQRVCVVIEFNSYVSGNVNIRNINQAGGQKSAPNCGIAYIATYNGSAWTKVQTQWPTVAIKYSDGTYAYMPEVYPFSNASNPSFSNVSTAKEIALKLNIPFKCKVTGAWVSAINTTGDFDIVVYASDGTTVVCSGSYDKDTNMANQPGRVWFTSETELAPGTYYVTFKPTTSTGIGVYYVEVASAAIFDQVAAGQNAIWSQRNTQGSGAFTDTTTRRLHIGLLISALDDGAGSGGGVYARAPYTVGF